MYSRFTDIFIKRPVLATVVSLLILVLGFRAIFSLSVRQYPQLENTVITVTTYYPGASARLVQGFITTPLEKKIASAGGIDYLTSETTEGTSTLSAHILLNYSPNDAFTNVMSKVSEAKYELPTEAEDPIVAKSTGDSFALMYVGFSSPHMTSEQITDYISRVIQPKIETVPGVSEAQILGGNDFAMRIWLNPKRMAALGVSPTDVKQALINNNYQSAAGSTRGDYISLTINAHTDLKNAKEFEDLIIKQDKGNLVRLRDVARVELGSQNYDSSVYFNGKKAIFMAVNATPEANPLTVIDHVRQILPTLEKEFPPSLHASVVFDATKFINASLHEVLKTIFEATLIVIVIIFLFLGSFRSVSIPVVTIPLSLIGVFALMLMMGYSINLLTLLALVLAIGMVVDDAIVVVENIHRHIEEGIPPHDAALQGAREIAFPVIAMTFTLAAVYAPIAFMGGITGALFKEFALTLAGAVVLSGIIALTLSPMMCSYVLSQAELQKPLARYVDQQFSRLKNWYQGYLHTVLNYRKLLIIFSVIVLVSCFFLFLTAKKELAPQEDQGVAWVMGQAPESANIHYTEAFTKELGGVYHKYNDALQDFFVINGWGNANTMGSGFLMKPWQDRSMTEAQLVAKLNVDLGKITGLDMQAVAPPALPGSGLFPISFVVTSVQPLSVIYPLAQKLIDDANRSGLFLFVFSDLKYNKPQVEVMINREKAAQMDISMQSIADALSTTLGGNYVNRFAMDGRAYQVIPQLDQHFRANPDKLNQIYIKTLAGTLIPLSTVVSLRYQTEPNKLTRFQQLNSATIQGMMMPGKTIDEGLQFFRDKAKTLFPSGVTYNYSGESRRYMQEGNALMMAFTFSLIFIFLVLAAQFESFRDPLVVMISVPMAICGALLPISWGLASINIYTQVGLITLIGLISKHGILMVDFANQLREKEKLDRAAAIEKAAAIRLRPILMTTAAMILGVFPLLIATGAGAVSRFDIGLVIASGMAIGTIFTLFVVPVMYTLKPKTILLFLSAVFVIVVMLYFWFFKII
ncbi:MAG: multidrug efflux protein [Gammaproteobacteria bacterium CG_4_10_14_0_8_um_filter_38_16]|nr:MAG: multidrug efflux protein [Gammaproteobacteria bacterium CG_4_10_14_0_8_um_filter_38_16]PJA03731.1 MAG: multidrug efflux protein [Gammaproteobacteria bacterium CG_4_10_14_0_2_um_filter_38_22]